jgi:hypothetical protein
MNLISKYTYSELCNQLIGKIVNFKSDCQFFPNFDVTGKVLSITINKNNEYIIKILRNGKTYDIGSNMKNLNFTLRDQDKIANNS